MRAPGVGPRGQLPAGAGDRGVTLAEPAGAVAHGLGVHPDVRVLVVPRAQQRVPDPVGDLRERPPRSFRVLARVLLSGLRLPVGLFERRQLPLAGRP